MTSSQYALQYETVLTHPKPDAAIIWLHGLGANGHDFVPIVPELALPAEAKIRFIFPHSPQLSVTINGGMVMPAWYDILELSLDRKIDHKHILSSSQAIHTLLRHELDQGIASERLLLAGFSQGGAVVYEAGLSFDQPLGGLMALSTYFPTHETVAIHPANRAVPIHISHGTADPIVPLALGQKAHKILREYGFQAEFRSYPMPHSVCPEQVRDLSAWICSRLLPPSHHTNTQQPLSFKI